MPNIKSAAKRMRTSRKSRLCNNAKRARVHTDIQAVKDAIASGDAARIKKAMSVYFSALDKAAKTNVITKNTVNRSKSRAVKAARAVSAIS